MQLIVSPQARADLREAYRFVAANNHEAADRLPASASRTSGSLGVRPREQGARGHDQSAPSAGSTAERSSMATTRATARCPPLPPKRPRWASPGNSSRRLAPVGCSPAPARLTLTPRTPRPVQLAAMPSAMSCPDALALGGTAQGCAAGRSVAGPSAARHGRQGSPIWSQCGQPVVEHGVWLGAIATPSSPRQVTRRRQRHRTAAQASGCRRDCGPARPRR